MRSSAYIKKHSEKLPFIMVVFFMICFLCTEYDFYFYGYDLMQNICEVSLLFCIFMYGNSDKWGFIAKKSLYTLFALNILNIVHEITPLTNYYSDYLIIIYAFFITLIIYDKCRRSSTSING